MNILFVGHNASYTGAPKSLLRIIKYLSVNSGFDVELLLRDSGPMLLEYKGLCEVTEFVPTKYFLTGIFFIDLFKKIGLRFYWKFLFHKLKGQNFDLIYCNTVVNGNVLSFLSKLKIPIVTHQREMHTAIDAYGGKPLIEVMDRHTTQFISVSEKAKSVLVEYGVLADKIRVIYNFLETTEMFTIDDVERNRLRDLHGIPRDAFIVLNVGTCNNRKGVDLFIETALDVISKNRNIYFLWIGGGELSEDLTNKISSFQEIMFLGEIPHPYAYYQVSNLVFLSSRDDPFPLTALEASYYGLPVICFDETGGIAEVLMVDDLVIKPFDLKTVSKKIEELYIDANKLESLGQLCHQRLYLNLNIDTQVGEILNVLENVSKRN